MSILGLLIVLLVIGILLPRLGLAVDPLVRDIILIVLIIALVGWLVGGMHVITL